MFIFRQLEDEMEKTQEKIKATKVVIENVEKRLRPVEVYRVQGFTLLTDVTCKPGKPGFSKPD